MAQIRVAAATLNLLVGDVEGNRAAAYAALTEAGEAGIALVVLPELVQSGYVFADAAEARTLAEPVTGPTITQWQERSAAYGMTVVGGFCELGEEGAIYNSAVLIESGQVLACYRKVHLWDAEQDVFTPGSERPPVVDTALGRIGMLVCYDLEFPEWVRLIGLADAQILAAPTNWPLSPRPADEQPLGVIKVQANAATNALYVVAADRRGVERGVDWVRGSVIVGPDGFRIAGPRTDDPPLLLVAEIDPGRAADKRIGPRNHIVDDRRTDLYRVEGVFAG